MDSGGGQNEGEDIRKPKHQWIVHQGKFLEIFMKFEKNNFKIFKIEKIMRLIFIFSSNLRSKFAKNAKILPFL